MIQYQHNDYEFYLNAQRRMTSRKTRRGRTYFTWITGRAMKRVNAKVREFLPEIKAAVCHGCRCGTEVKMLQNLNPNAEIIGTDIYGKAYMHDRKWFREMDFDIVPPEWVGHFDLVYSNSIDHSRNPINTLLAWKSELKPDGVCFVNFHWGRGVSKEDCFHLDGIDYQAEIREIAKKVGMEAVYISKDYSFADGASCADVVLKWKK